MNSVGIDLHRKRSFVAVIDDHGELTTSRRIVNDRDTFLELLGGLEGESQIAVEATRIACTRSGAAHTVTRMRQWVTPGAN